MGKQKIWNHNILKRLLCNLVKKDVFLALPPSFTNNFSILLQLLCHSLTFKKMTHILDVEVFLLQNLPSLIFFLKLTT